MRLTRPSIFSLTEVCNPSETRRLNLAIIRSGLVRESIAPIDRRYRGLYRSTKSDGCQVELSGALSRNGRSWGSPEGFSDGSCYDQHNPSADTGGDCFRDPIRSYKPWVYRSGRKYDSTEFYLSMKKWLFLLFVPSLASAVGEGVPKVSPSTAVVTVNGSIQLTTTFSVTWSLLSGSYGAISSTGLYHATTGYFQAQNLSSAGTQIGPNDAIWNTDLTNAPLDANSAAKIQFLTVNVSTPKITFQPTVPRNQYATGISSQAMVFRSNPQWNGSYFFMPSSFTRVEQASVMSNRNVSSSGAQDHHILGISTDTLLAFEIYQHYNAGQDAVVPLSNNESGCIYDPNSHLLPVATGNGTCTNAAGLYFQPFLLRNSELESGQINHTLFCTLNNGNVYGAFQWPATNSTPECTDATKCIKYGSIFRLRAGYSCSTKFSTAGGQAVCAALQSHGCIMGDGGTALAIVADYDLLQSTRDFASTITDFQFSASSISSSDLQVLDVSSLMKSSFTANVDPSNTVVTPTQFIQVLARNTVDGKVSSTTIALQPVAVGWQNPAFQGDDGGVSTMAKTPTFTIPAWVTGSTDTAFNCSMSPTVGSISSNTAGCLYTAPTSQYNRVLITTVTISSRIDPNHNSAKFFLTVFSSDAIRVRDGPATSGLDTKPPYDDNGNYTDATTGNMYFETPTNMYKNWTSRSTQGSASWPSQLYNNYDYSSGDKVFSAMVASGTYTLISAHGANQSADVTLSSNSIESQGVLLVDTITLAPALLVPRIVTSTITVGSDYRFHWRIIGNQESSHNFMSYFTLTPLAVPVVTSALTASGTVGTAFSYQIVATNSPTSYGASGLPGGLSVSAGTGIISGTPTAAGTTSVTINATNSLGTGQNSTLVITIAAAPAPAAPSRITIDGLQTWTGNITVFPP